MSICWQVEKIGIYRNFLFPFSLSKTKAVWHWKVSIYQIQQKNVKFLAEETFSTDYT